jgi:deoxycytidine triphosphate deaminase
MVAALLFDKLIIEAVKQGELVIEAPDGRKLIDPRTGQLATGPDLPSPGLDAHRYVLHARRVCSWRANTESPWIDLESKDFVIHPGELVFIETYERLTLSRKICGTIHGLARLALLGFSPVSSTTVHPGWGVGQDGPQPLRIAFHNLGNLSIKIRYKEPIACILFHKSEVEAEIPSPSPQTVFKMMEEAIERHKKTVARRRGYLVCGLLSGVPIFIAVARFFLLPSFLPSPIFAVLAPALDPVLNATASLAFVYCVYVIFGIKLTSER